MSDGYIDVNRTAPLGCEHRFADHRQVSVLVHGARTVIRLVNPSSSAGAPLTMSAVVRHAERIARGRQCATVSSPSSPSRSSPEEGSRTAPTTSCKNQPVTTVNVADPAGRGRRRRSVARRGAEEGGPARSPPFPAGQAPEGVFADAAGHRRPRHHRADRQERADPGRQAGVEGSRLRTAAGHSRGHARRVGAGQRGRRRRRLRAARHARRRRRDREPDDEPDRHDLEGRARQRAGADRRHAHGAGPRRRASRCRSPS